MARKRTRRAGSPSGKGSQHGAKKSRSASIVRRTSKPVNIAKLSARSQEARARALHVLADLRRNPEFTISQAAHNREVSLSTIRRYIGSQLKQDRPGGRITVTKGDRLSAYLYIPTTQPDVFQNIHAHGSEERALVGEWIAALNEAARGDFTRINKFPKGKSIDGVRLPTDTYEVQRVLEAMANSEKPFEDLYATAGAR
jgi:hypothetical protein